MWWQLFCKEMKYYLKSITYYIFIVAVVIFYSSQMTFPKSIDDIKPLTKEEIAEKVSKMPAEQREYTKARLEHTYGTKPMTDIKMKQKAMYNYMDMNLEEKVVVVYKFGFAKRIKLSDKQGNAFKAAMESISPEKQISNEEFINTLNDLDKILGGGSYYGEELRGSILKTSITYEEALADFNIKLKEDKITNAEGRVFADYMGITAGIFPMFIAAFILIRDLKSGAQEVIFSKKTSSLKYVLTKYLAAIVSLMVPYVFTATHGTLTYGRLAANSGISIDYFAFYKYVLLWIVPTLMFVIALGMLFGVIFKKPIAAIIIQFLLWCSSIPNLYGSYGLDKYIIRFNSSVNNVEYMKWAK
ncbi:hypothetical protein M918_08000 [Clostridium sp. BL8]|uniref:ABC transporter permease n=1 Tax=Clostridium sp. BL8 TaxID=1354301 RepID=UPI000389F830|nr:ABC transporter permease [Clostridium sp. BL8]EQB87625.1 hypothetical protein M918_08000 [Clostridium sp. BL8]